MVEQECRSATVRTRRLMEPKSILVVEDEWEIRELIGYLLTECGYQVQYATDGQVALQKLAYGSVDLVLTDLMMPTMDGLELIQALRTTEEFAAIPVLMVTAVPESAVYERHPIPTGFLRKPFTSKELLSSVRALLEVSPK